MNETRFDAALRAVYSAPSEPITLDAKVQNALHQQGRARTFRRRLIWSLAGTGVAVLAMFAFPAVQAQASISGIARALDKVNKVVMKTYTVDEQGAKSLNATTVIADGDFWYRDALGRRESIEKGGKQYTFDPTLNEYIVSDNDRQGHLKLSEMLGPTGEFSIGKNVEIEHRYINGKPMIRAVITNSGLPERYIILADEVTDLPSEAQVESLEQGTWRERQSIAFNYNTATSIPGPDLARFKVTTPQAANAEFGKSMESRTLAERKFTKQRLVIRSIEVAQDGTVFVAYQSGDRIARSWKGYALNLTDDLETHYLRVGQFGSFMEGPFDSMDGKIEMEIFCPLHPISPSQPRKLAISTQSDNKGRVGRIIWAGITDSSGHTKYHWQPNYSPVTSPQGSIPVLSTLVPSATCATHPAWAESLDFTSYGNDVAADIQKADARGKAALEDSRWTDAESLFKEELRLMREHERKGYGPWSQSQVLDYLEQANAHIYKPR